MGGERESRVEGEGFGMHFDTRPGNSTEAIGSVTLGPIS